MLTALFAVMDSRETVVYSSLWRLGLRTSELQHAEFCDINYRTKALMVRAKPKYDFTIEDHEEREIPILEGIASTSVVRASGERIGTTVKGQFSIRTAQRSVRTLEAQRYTLCSFT